MQDPTNSQSLNRYSYVLNNPMAFTDPSGYWGHRQQGYLRTAVAIVISVWTGGAAVGLAAEGAWGSAMAVAFAGGFAAGAVQSGTGKGALLGGVTAMVFTGINGSIAQVAKDSGSSLSTAQYAERALANGAAGGVLASIQGQRFGSGFASAGLSSALNPAVDSVTGDPYGQGFMAAVVGGTVSEATGGKFANGAITGAFASAVGSAIAHGAATDDRGAGEERTDPDEISKVAALATKGANAALGDTVGHAYPDLDQAAVAWGARVGAVEKEYNAEIASRFFKVQGGFAYGAAVSDGLKYSVDPDGSMLRGAMFTAGYIHTHPTLTLFSPNDLDYSVGMYKKANGGWVAHGTDQPAFVVNGAGAIYRWNIDEWWSSGGLSWKNSNYYHRVGR